MMQTTETTMTTTNETNLQAEIEYRAELDRIVATYHAAVATAEEWYGNQPTTNAASAALTLSAAKHDAERTFESRRRGAEATYARAIGEDVYKLFP